MHSILADDWTTELAIIASNGFDFIQDRAFLFHISGMKLTFPSRSIKVHSHGASAAAIFLPQQMGCIGFNGATSKWVQNPFCVAVAVAS